MFFTCEIHNQHFSSLEQVKLHDSLYHKENDVPPPIKHEPSPLPPPPPEINIPAGYTCHICAQTYPTQDLVLTHLTSHLPPDQQNAKDDSPPVIKTEQDSDSNYSPDDDDSDTSGSEWSNSVATTTTSHDSDDSNHSDSSNSVAMTPRKCKKAANPVAMTPKRRNKTNKPRSFYRAVNSPHQPTTYNPLLPDGHVICYFCGYAPFPGRLHRFYVHVNKHTLEAPYRCGTCGRRMAGPEELVAHKKTHVAEHVEKLPPRRFTCHLCKSSFRAKSTLRGHLKTHSSAHAGFQCPHCDKRLKYERGLRRHRDSHTKDRTLIKCEVAGCKEKFKRRDHLKTHVTRCHGGVGTDLETTFPCTFCEEVFNFRWKYEIHAMKSHPREVKKLFRCEQCGVKLANFRQLREHCRTRRHLDRVKGKKKSGARKNNKK